MLTVAQRASVLTAAVVLAGAGLTGCQDSGSDASRGPGGLRSGGQSTAPASAASPEPPAAPSAAPQPDDLPEGMPLPQGTLASVDGTAGAYRLVYTVADPAAAVAAYGAALEAGGYTVDPHEGGVVASKDALQVVVTTTPTTLEVAFAAE
ncbi:hypothetical protein [Streptomyces sp. NPDC012888]|uniref:hypothetical protein n=1 Tax=Streptomyces sp. NPDC012888 TaxID=3364855 RepID=UPI0036C5D7DB